MNNARRTVVISLLVMLLVGVIQEFSNTGDSSTPGLRRFTGVFFLALFLAILAEIWPEMAAALAVLVAVATVLAYEDIFTAIQNATNR